MLSFPLKSPRCLVLAPPDTCVVPVSGRGNSAPPAAQRRGAPHPAESSLPALGPRLARPSGPPQVQALLGGPRPPAKHPSTGFPLFIHSTNTCSISDALSPPNTVRASLCWDTVLALFATQRRESRPLHNKYRFCGIYQAPSLRVPSGRELKATSPPLPKKALVNGTESPLHSVLASEPALCQVPSHREAPPRPQPAARASGPRAGRGLGVRLAHLQPGGGPQSGRGGPGGPGRFSSPRGGPAFGQRRGTTAPSSAAARTSGSRGCAGRKRRDPAQRPGLHLARKRGREGLWG